MRQESHRRFAGACEWIADADVDDVVDWITAISFSAWHQQHPIDAQLRPAMMTDPGWNGFGAVTDPVVFGLQRQFGWPRTTQRMLSVVMPGHSIPEHIDEQGPDWLARIHLPLTTNDQSQFLVDGAAHQMRVGSAYRVNTLARHGVRNDGATPRIHLMFDVVR